MGRFLRALLALLALGAVSSAAAASETANSFVESQYASEIDEAERLGAAIYAHDQAAWVSTDVLIEMFGDALFSKIGGWVETSTPQGVRVLYFSPDASRPAYAVEVRKGAASKKDVFEYPADAQFTPAEKSLVDARQLALRQEIQACSRNYNTVTLDAGDGAYFVYLLAATTEPNKVFFGGHYRFRVGQSGAEIVEFRKYTNSCIALPSAGPNGEEIVALVVSQLLTEHPTEVHVWRSLELGLDILVVTPNRALWRVRDGKIAFMKILEEKTAAGNAALQTVSVQESSSPLDDCLSRLEVGEVEASCVAGASVFPPQRGLREISPTHQSPH